MSRMDARIYFNRCKLYFINCFRIYKISFKRKFCIGRVALFPSYETFLGIITTMMIQYAKFIKIGMETSWRLPIGSLNYIETSTLWRQEHNGFSHQNPSFINNLINMKCDYPILVYSFLFN